MRNPIEESMEILLRKRKKQRLTKEGLMHPALVTMLMGRAEATAKVTTAKELTQEEFLKLQKQKFRLQLSLRQ
jgi:hypothetical protein